MNPTVPLAVSCLLLIAAWYAEYRNRLAADYRFEALLHYTKELEKQEQAYIELPTERMVAVQPVLTVVRGGQAD